MSDKLSAFLNADNEKIDKLIEDNPKDVSIKTISEFLSMDIASVRAAIENNVFGISWRKNGSARSGYFIPTTQFVRWYLNI